MTHQCGLAVMGAVLDSRNRIICARPLCYCISSPRRPLCAGDPHRASKSVRSHPLRLYTRRSAFNSATTFSDMGSLKIMPLPLVGQELALIGDPDAVALGVLDPFQIHLEVDGAHDAVAKLLMDQGLYSGAVDLRNFVYPVDGGVHGNVGVE